MVTAVDPGGRNRPCPCGSGRKRKKCHPDGVGARPWSLWGEGATAGGPMPAAASARGSGSGEPRVRDGDIEPGRRTPAPSAPAGALAAAGRDGDGGEEDDADFPGAPGEGPTGGIDPRFDEELARAFSEGRPPPVPGAADDEVMRRAPGPVAARLGRQLVEDRSLTMRDLDFIGRCLNARLRRQRDLDQALARVVLREGMRVYYEGRGGPTVGVLEEIRRTRGLVCVDGDHWLVSLHALRPVQDAPSATPGARPLDDDGVWRCEKHRRARGHARSGG